MSKGTALVCARASVILMNKGHVTVAFDTSNYTTSAAVFDIDRGEIIANLKMPLEVREGERGLRQSEALFAHIKNLPTLCTKLSEHYEHSQLCAVGCSAYPRDAENSYMPCFLAGKSAAYALASSGVPIYEFSHQSGHVAAALWHCGKRELFEKEHIAFHVSGGTTEILHVLPDDAAFKIECVGGTSDINAGQLIDRVGVMLGLRFPCGPALEVLADEFAKSGKKCSITQKICVDKMTCNLSGGENKASAALKSGASRDEVAYFILDLIARTLDAMSKSAEEVYGRLPIVYAGGVMSNGMIKEYLKCRHDAAFAPPEYSADNACGTAILSARRFMKDAGSI